MPLITMQATSCTRRRVITRMSMECRRMTWSRVMLADCGRGRVGNGSIADSAAQNTPDPQAPDLKQESEGEMRRWNGCSYCTCTLLCRQCDVHIDLHDGFDREDDALSACIDIAKICRFARCMLLLL